MNHAARNIQSRTLRKIFHCAALTASAMPLLVAGSVPAFGGPPTCPDLPMVMFQGGDMDDLGGSFEVTSRSEELETRLPDALWKDFDDPAINRNFGHSFENLPAGITAIEIEVRALAGGDNDFLHFHDSAMGPSLYAAQFSTFSGAGGTWNSFNNPNPISFFFDFANLPDGSSILADIAESRRLDIYVQDDTAIDYLKLKVWYQPQETYRAGTADDFAAPNEAASRSSYLSALRSEPFAWKDFDDGRSNLGVGHTFTGLPSGITEASLEIRMRPHSDAPSNDSLLLGYDQLNSTFVYSTSISNLPESGGTWNNGQGSATFHIDLDALPEGPSLLSLMSVSGRLDLYVQDDTAVDYAVLRVRGCPARPRVCGIPHTVFGEAEIFGHRPRSFTLTNLGPSGNDGARIELGETRGWGFTLVDPLDVPGSSRSWTMRGKVDGLLDQPIFTETLDVMSDGGDGTRVRVSHDHSARGATQVAARFFAADGSLLHQTTLDNGPMYEFDFTVEPPPFVVQWDATCVVRPIPPLSAVTVADGAALVDVGKIELQAVNPTKPVEFCSAVESRGTNLSEARIEDEILVIWDCPLWTAGRPSLEAFAGNVHVGDLGPSGRDGITFGLDGADAVLIDLLPIDPDDEALSGSFLRVDATGERGGVPNQDLGTLHITKTAAQTFEYATDFTELATDQQRLQIWNGGTLVEERIVPAGVAVTSDRWPDGLGKLGGGLECFVGTFPPGTVFTPTTLAPRSRGGSQTVIGDELRLLAEGGTTVTGKSTFTLRAAGLSSFTVENAVLEPDLHGDVVFSDGFESGDLSRWSGNLP